MVEKLDLPFPLRSDPRGDLIKRFELWNEKVGVSKPAAVVVDKSGVVRRLYSGGTDFSDRPPEEVLHETLEEVRPQIGRPPKAASLRSWFRPRRPKGTPCVRTSPP